METDLGSESPAFFSLLLSRLLLTEHTFIISLLFFFGEIIIFRRRLESVHCFLKTVFYRLFCKEMLVQEESGDSGDQRNAILENNSGNWFSLVLQTQSEGKRGNSESE